ncbi:hypothetical protein [Scytonema sp. NUACC26]|uniref:hypothetical protein n=1 Tax=Scytonema sp. NUACC26 TaxID=3140176 RepID=UPI0038B2A31C
MLYFVRTQVLVGFVHIAHCDRNMLKLLVMTTRIDWYWFSLRCHIFCQFNDTFAIELNFELELL